MSPPRVVAPERVPVVYAGATVLGQSANERRAKAGKKLRATRKINDVATVACRSLPESSRSSVVVSVVLPLELEEIN